MNGNPLIDKPYGTLSQWDQPQIPAASVSANGINRFVTVAQQFDRLDLKFSRVAPSYAQLGPPF